jgi:hypothetical protein
MYDRLVCAHLRVLRVWLGRGIVRTDGCVHRGDVERCKNEVPMITAEKTREVASAFQMGLIIKAIERAAQEGQMCVRINGFISPSNRRFFETRGYDVRQSSTNVSTGLITILWRDILSAEKEKRLVEKVFVTKTKPNMKLNIQSFLQIWLLTMSVIFAVAYLISDQPHQFVVSQINLVGCYIITAIKHRTP